MKIIIGTRASELALAQAHWVAARLKENHPEIEFVLKEIKTKGDKLLEVALSKIGDKGLFVKEIETALLAGEVDLAVHSMKDLPTFLEEGLEIGAITEREDVRDALISKRGLKLAQLPAGSLIGTSSLRRKAQLLSQRPDLKIVDLRGNLNTRFRKLEETDLDAIVLAAAGVKRLGWEERITEFLSPDWILPAVGQGALGIEIREKDDYIKSITQCLNSPTVFWSVLGERAFLRTLEGGCQIPIGCLGELKDGELTIRGVVASLDGKELLRKEIKGKLEDSELLGKELAQNLLHLGAKDILDQVRRG